MLSIIQKYIILLFVLSNFSVIGQGQDPRCPVFQNGVPGSPNAFVTFYTQNASPIVTCFCQLTGNELKCSFCKPADNLWYYYTITINGVTVICYNDLVLAVEWGEMNVRRENNHVVVNWETITEVNNRLFHIERSADGKEINRIGSVNGSGFSEELLSYTFIDKTSNSKEIYYRIVQEDFDGTQTFSDWIHLWNSQEIDYLPILPNPNKGDFTLYINDSSESKIVSIYDLVGRIVFKQQLVTGENFISTKLAIGKYSLVIDGLRPMRSEIIIF